MRKLTICVLTLISFALVGSAVAGEAKTVTLEGKVVCAKCTLKEEGRTECQDVLVVKKDDKDDMMNYYIVKNDVADKFGHVCEMTKFVKMTGTVAEKDGAMWITASKIEAVEET